ncbi:MAG: ATP-dependent DNA helicase RecG, partial [Mycobacterium sp.]|nr:ATP-dependent DNA helicase RecG [Mycobacterium sp.]
MVGLADSLVPVLGAKSAAPLEEFLGIRTVNDLLRHYPRKYSQGMTVLGEDTELPEEGDHVTFLDVITKAETRWTNRAPKREYLVVTLGHRNPKVTATFFNAKFLKKTLVEGTRVMLSGVVGFYGRAMQLTHPAHLILNSGAGRNIGSPALKKIADASEKVHGELQMSAFEREYFPIYAACAKVQSWDIYACVLQVLAVLDPIPDPLPESLLAQRGLISEDQALRDIHLGEREQDREQARHRLTFDEAAGLQWALAARRHGAQSQSGPAAPPAD